MVADAAYGLAAVAADYLSDDDAARRRRVADFEAAGGAVDVPSYFESPTQEQGQEEP